MDKLDALKRSANMRRIRSEDSKPEMIVRRMVTKLGYRYRLHCKDLPGRPDLTFRGRRAVIFVHGCFWHQHEDCREGRYPKSRPEYWIPKLEKNIHRDAAALEALGKMGWRTLVIWECEVSSPSLVERINLFLQG